MAQSGQCKPANSGLPTSTQFCFPGKTDITHCGEFSLVVIIFYIVH